MSIGLLGKKLGMTHLYDEYGRRMTVTAVQAGPCTILQVREPKAHRYHAVQVGFEAITEAKLTKAEAGQFKKTGTGPFRYVREFRLPVPRQSTLAGQAGLPNGQATAADGGEGDALKAGQQLTVSLFQENELVDVCGISIGKGFQGGMNRWHWKGGRETHGSMQHRQPGSIGSTTTPGRVWRGHHLPGHMGLDRVTVQNVRIVRLDPEQHLIFVAGSVPGPENALVEVRKSIKRPGVIRKPQAFQVETDEEEEKLNKNAKAAKAKAPAKK